MSESTAVGRDVAEEPGAALDMDAVAQVVVSCPSVARLTSGSGVEVVTYLPGRRLEGVRMVGGHLEVHVVARYGPAMSEVAGEIRHALLPTLGDIPVSVVIHDLEIDLDHDGGAEEAGRG